VDHGPAAARLGVSLLRRAEPPRSELITGERLQALAEVSLMSRGTREFHRGVERYAPEIVLFEESPEELGDEALERLSRARSIFVYTQDVDAFAEHVWPRLEHTAGKLLISHNSDHEIEARHARWLDGDGAALGRWLAQNVTVAHPKLEPLPIGISNSMWPHGNLRALSRVMRRHAGREKSGSIFLSFKVANHPSRAATAATLRESFPGVPLDPDPMLPWPKYLDLLATHRFCACPRGNGVDTHRVWESLYLGVTPVVERSVLTEHVRDQGLPLVLIDDWSEVTPEWLEHVAPRERDERPLRLSSYASLTAAATEPSTV
jgi:hypothetical protein